MDVHPNLREVSCSEAYQKILEGTVSDYWKRRMDEKWRAIINSLDLGWRCSYCGFLSFGDTSIEQLEMGSQTGRQCCKIVLDAVRAWHDGKPELLNGVKVRAWEIGHIRKNRITEEYFGSSIVLKLPHDSMWYPSLGETINIFKVGPATDAATDFVSKVPFVERRRPQGNTDSEQALRTMKQWIQECSTHHKHRCGVHPRSQLPKRILELLPGGLRLCEEIRSEKIYACLSHCWGSNGPALTLTRGTLERLKSGVPYAELPRTFREATELCLRLDIHYLWIDALCIIQQDKDDWKEAAATMASIFEKAYVTIAATSSRNSEDGLYSKMQGLSQAKRLETSGLYACKRRVRDFPVKSRDVLSEDGPWPLLRRAWVFQERLLSTRIIHFTDYQVIWECKSMQESETGDVSDVWSNHAGEFQKSWDHFGSVEQPFKFWHEEDGRLGWLRAVAHYSHLQLTFPSDRLPAIAAIVQRIMQHRKDDEYIAGMWKSFLIYDLAWHCIDQATDLTRLNDTIPTWSWASAPSAIMFPEVYPLPSTELCAIHYVTSGPAHIGEVRGASISLRGRVLDTTLRWVDTTTRWLDDGAAPLRPYIWAELPEGFRHLKRIGWETYPDFDLTQFHASRPGIDSEVMEMAVSILFLWGPNPAWSGIVLRQRANGTAFERMGYCELNLPVSSLDRFRTCMEMVESLPIREFEIV